MSFNKNNGYNILSGKAVKKSLQQARQPEADTAAERNSTEEEEERSFVTNRVEKS